MIGCFGYLVLMTNLLTRKRLLNNVLENIVPICIIILSCQLRSTKALHTEKEHFDPSESRPPLQECSPALHKHFLPSCLCLFKPQSPANACLEAAPHTWLTPPRKLPFCRDSIALLPFLILPMLQNVGLLVSRLWIFLPCFSLPIPCDKCSQDETRSKSSWSEGSNGTRKGGEMILIGKTWRKVEDTVS